MSDCLDIFSAPFIGGQSAITGLLVLILTRLVFFINRRLLHKPQNFMGQASASVVASRKSIERPTRLNCNFVCRQLLIEWIFYNDLPVFDCSLLFHSFPVLSFVLSREQAQQMSTHLRFWLVGKSQTLYFLSLNIPFERQLLLHFPPHYIKIENRKIILTYHAICDILNQNMFLPRNAYSYSSRPWKE